MDMYNQKSKSIPQKSVILFIELGLLWLAYWILFQAGGSVLLEKTGISPNEGNQTARLIIFTFSLVVFVRLQFMMFYLLKRKIPWEESISIPMAFALYYVGFALLVYNRQIPIDWIDYLGVFIFVLGSYLNTASELQRHFWKKKPENKGKLYTIGLFKYAMHINFFGDVLWVTGYAIVTRNYYSTLIPVMLFCLFAFWNIPILDKYLAEKYEGQFEKYSTKVKKLVPFVY